MPMIPRADAATIAREAVVLDLGDLARQGEAMVDRARREADRIIEEAKAERERLISGAVEQGHAEGLERGLEEGRSKGHEDGRAAALTSQQPVFQRLEAAWQEALAAFEKRRDALHSEAERGVVSLAVKLGERVAKRAIEVDEQAAARQLGEAIGLAMRPGRLRVRVSPTDARAVREAMPAFADRLGESASVELVEDEALSHGSVIVEADESRIDGTIETQLERIVGALLPGESS
ncbi:MAG: FliH/SctL family protein [Phycisphaerales bacterium]|jgi:flagellar assembly protein FliH